MLTFIAIGGLVGFLSGLFGVGGGFVLVPLIILMGVPVQLAIGSSLAFLVPTTLSGVVQHHRYGHCDTRLALVFVVCGAAGSQLGAFSTTSAGGSLLRILLSLLLVSMGIGLQFQKGSTTGPATLGHASEAGSIPTQIRDRKIQGSLGRVLRASVIGIVVGFLSGLLGVGGGFVLVPLQVIVLGVPMHIACGTSLLAVLGLAVSGTVAHWTLGNVNFEIVALMLSLIHI